MLYPRKELRWAQDVNWALILANMRLIQPGTYMLANMRLILGISIQHEVRQFG